MLFFTKSTIINFLLSPFILSKKVYNKLFNRSKDPIVLQQSQPSRSPESSVLPEKEKPAHLEESVTSIWDNEGERAQLYLRIEQFTHLQTQHLATITELEKHNDKLNRENVNLHSARKTDIEINVKQQQQISQLEKELNIAKNDSIELTEKFKTSETTHKENMNNEKQRYTLHTATLQRQVEQLKTTNTISEDEQNSLKNEVEHLTTEKEIFIRTNNNQLTEIKRLTAELTQIAEKIILLETQKQELNTKLDQLNTNFELRVASTVQKRFACSLDLTTSLENKQKYELELEKQHKTILGLRETATKTGDFHKASNDQIQKLHDELTLQNRVLKGKIDTYVRNVATLIETQENMLNSKNTRAVYNRSYDNSKDTQEEEHQRILQRLEVTVNTKQNKYNKLVKENKDLLEEIKQDFLIIDNSHDRLLKRIKTNTSVENSLETQSTLLKDKERKDTLLSTQHQSTQKIDPVKPSSSMSHSTSMPNLSFKKRVSVTIKENPWDSSSNFPPRIKSWLTQSDLELESTKRMNNTLSNSRSQVNLNEENLTVD